MDLNYKLKEDDYLQHWGTGGMKWGIRRYQNEDGTLTEEGKARYRVLFNKAAEYKKKRNENYEKSKAHDIKSDISSTGLFKTYHDLAAGFYETRGSNAEKKLKSIEMQIYKKTKNLKLNAETKPFIEAGKKFVNERYNKLYADWKDKQAKQESDQRWNEFKELFEQKNQEQYT